MKFVVSIKHDKQLLPFMSASIKVELEIPGTHHFSDFPPPPKKSFLIKKLVKLSSSEKQWILHLETSVFICA